MFNRHSGGRFFLRKQKMENPGPWLKATPIDKPAGVKSHMINQLNTQQFLNNDTSFERPDNISDKIWLND
jgi:hypothetical protein